jgi:hypothetical protein
MMLSKVEYEFFEYEEPSSTAQELERQIRMQFADAPTLYVSWTWERQSRPGSEPYSIAYAESSYFADREAHVLDVSDSPVWSKHIGRDVELAYAPSSSPEAEYQVLEIRSLGIAGALTARTYVYSLGLDRVGISETSPIVRASSHL